MSTDILLKVVTMYLEEVEKCHQLPRSVDYQYTSNHDPHLGAHWKGIQMDPDSTSLAEIASSVDWIESYVLRTHHQLDNDFPRVFNQLRDRLAELIIAKWKTGYQEEIVYLDNTAFIKNNCWS